MQTEDKKHREKQKLLHFRFTQTGFMLDNRDRELAEEIIPWKERFEVDKWEAVYAIGFEEKPKWLDAAGLFLYQVAERIFFHLVESKEDDHPFAFLATYATKDTHDKVRHMPLAYALTEYQADRGKLLQLLSCLNKVSEVSPLIGEFVEKGELFHPLRLTADEAYQILKEVPMIEECGIVCRIPNWWKRNAYGITMSVSLGEEKPPLLGLDTILGMTPQLVVDGVPLSRALTIGDSEVIIT